MGQEAVEIFTRSMKEASIIVPESIMINDLSRHITEYAHNPADIKDLTNDLVVMSEIIID